jgi:hypothetical protein
MMLIMICITSDVLAVDEFVTTQDEIRLNLRSIHHADCGGCNEVPLGVGLHRLFGEHAYLNTGAGMFVDSHESYAGYVEIGGGVHLDSFLPLPSPLKLRTGYHRMVHWGAAGRHASDTEPVDYFSLTGSFYGIGVRYIRMPVVDVFQLVWEFN